MKFFSKKNLILFFICFVLFFTLSHYFEKFLTIYLEKSSFVWEVLKTKKPISKEIDLLILGDSQILSGVHPKLLEQSFYSKNEKTLKYFYYPRPSEQLEGVYHFLLSYVDTKKLQPKKVIWNLSPIHFTKNGLMESNKKLFLERNEWSPYLFLNKEIRDFYFPKKVHFLRYVLINFFPFYRISSVLNTEFALIPRSLNLNLQSHNLSEYVEHDPFLSLQKNRQRNELILTSLEENHGYVDWNLDENKENKECFVSSFRVPLEAKFSYSIPRPSAYETLKQIINLLKNNQVDYDILVVPFSPSSEKIFDNFSSNSPFGKIIEKWKKDFPSKTWHIIQLEEADYGDFVHPNFCGAKKITFFILESIFK